MERGKREEEAGGFTDMRGFTAWSRLSFSLQRLDFEVTLGAP